MIQWEEPEWKRDESGYFFFDIGGAILVLAGMLAVLAYINVQLSFMSDLEGNITADYLAREQLDILCIEQRATDLGTRNVEENGHVFQVISTREPGMLTGMAQYRVAVEWQDGRGPQRIDISRNTIVETKTANSENVRP